MEPRSHILSFFPTPITPSQSALSHPAQRRVTSSNESSSNLSSLADLSRPGQEATEWEIDNLLHVVDDIPVTVWLAALVGAAERFAWYGNTGPLRKSIGPIPRKDPSKLSE